MLLPGHLEELKASGLSSATIVGNNVYSASGPEVSALLGYVVGPALVFPYDLAGPNATPTYARAKLDHAGIDGKRYRSPLGRGNHLYIPFTANPWSIGDTGRTLYITEGEKKTLKATQEGLVCVGLSGVWSWRHKPHGKNSRSVPIDDLHVIPWTQREVVIVFDSDAATNEDVKAAECALAEELTRRGAVVGIKRLPGRAA